MTSKKRDLRAGLSKLLTNIETTQNNAEKQEYIKELSSSIASIPLSKIEVNPYQPRTEFDENELMELASSIKVHGLIQPLTVRSMGGDTYQLISGERRMRACKMAGIKEVPAYVRVANDQEMLEWALIENIQRAELNAIEIAISYQRLMDECSLTHEAMSDRVGKNRSTITNYVRLLKLPPEIQSSIKEGELSMGHARALAGVSDVAKQITAFKSTLDKSWSVRDLESYLKPGNSSAVSINAGPKVDNSELDVIAQKISNHLGTKIDYKRNAQGKGQLIIKFNNDKQLNQIIEGLGIKS